MTSLADELTARFTASIAAHKQRRQNRAQDRAIRAEARRYGKAAGQRQRLRRNRGGDTERNTA